MKRYGKGNNVSHPREVTEIVHKFNEGIRGGRGLSAAEDQEFTMFRGLRRRKSEVRQRLDLMVRIRGFDLNNFFTEVPRGPFQGDLRAVRAKINGEGKGWKFF
jgi:hypothetical protein